jgi:hypothetical protein
MPLAIKDQRSCSMPFFAYMRVLPELCAGRCSSLAAFGVLLCALARVDASAMVDTAREDALPGEVTSCTVLGAKSAQAVPLCTSGGWPEQGPSPEHGPSLLPTFGIPAMNIAPVCTVPVRWTALLSSLWFTSLLRAGHNAHPRKGAQDLLLLGPLLPVPAAHLLRKCDSSRMHRLVSDAGWILGCNTCVML